MKFCSIGLNWFSIECHECVNNILILLNLDFFKVLLQKESRIPVVKCDIAETRF